MSRRARPAVVETMNRHEAARYLAIHQDTLTARMRDGAASAVVEWGGRGKLMKFSRFHLTRWAAAYRCTRHAGQPCFNCRTVLEDCETTAEHLLDTRHGVGGCDECTAPWLTIPHKETT